MKVFPILFLVILSSASYGQYESNSKDLTPVDSLVIEATSYLKRTVQFSPSDQVEFRFEDGKRRWLVSKDSVSPLMQKTSESDNYFNVNAGQLREVYVARQYSIKGERFRTDVEFNNPLKQLTDERFICTLYPVRDDPGTNKSRKEFYLNSRIGVFSKSGNALLIDTVMMNDVRERVDLSTILMAYPISCQTRNGWVSGFNMTDRLWLFSGEGKWIQELTLPSELKFEQYEGDTAQTYANYQKSEALGDQNVKVICSGDLLAVITLKVGRDQFGYPSQKLSNQRNWKVSLYNLKTKNWLKGLAFNAQYDFRNVFLMGNKLYVRKVGVGNLFEGFEVK